MFKQIGFRRQRAASLTGYGLIVGLIAIAAITAVRGVGEEVTSLFGGVAGQMSAATGSTGGSGGNGGDSSGDEDEEADVTPPVFLSLLRYDPEDETTDADELVFRATFSEAIEGIDTGDFSVTGETTATISDIAGALDIYDLTISGGDLAGFNGVVGVALETGHGITDLAGNPLPDDPPAVSESYILENIPPGAWDIGSSPVYSGSFSLASQGHGMNDLFFNPDGTRLYALGAGTDSIYQYDLDTAWDISVGVNFDVGFSIAAQGTNPEGMFFRSDGTRFYVIEQNSDTIQQYDLGTAWDIDGTVTPGATYSTLSQDGTPRDTFFRPDGTRFFMIGSTTDRVYQYDLTIPWDVGSTVTPDPNFFGVSGQDGGPNGMFFRSDGTRFYMAGQNSDAIHQYDLGTVWNIGGTVTVDTSFSIAAQEGSIQGMFFKPDGTRFYIVGSDNNTVYQYDLD